MLCCVRQCKNRVVTKTAWRQQWCNSHSAYHGDEQCTCSFPKWLRFPRKKSSRDTWIKLVNRKDWEPARSQLICSKHFKDGMPSRENPNPTECMGYKLKNQTLSHLPSMAGISAARPTRRRKAPQQDADFVFELPRKKSKTPRLKLIPSPIPEVVKEEPRSDAEESESEQAISNAESVHQQGAVKKPPVIKADLFYASVQSEPITVQLTKPRSQARPLCEQTVFCNGCRLRNAEIRKLQERVRQLEAERDQWHGATLKTEQGDEELNSEHHVSISEDDAVTVAENSPAPHVETSNEATVNERPPSPVGEEAEAPAPIIVAPTLEGGTSIIVAKTVVPETITEEVNLTPPDEQYELDEDRKVNIIDFLNEPIQEDPPIFSSDMETNSCIQLRRIGKLKVEDAWALLCGPSPLIPISCPPFQPQGNTIYLWSKKSDGAEAGESAPWHGDGYHWKNNGTRILRTEGNKTMVKRHYKLVTGEKKFLRYAFMIKGAEDLVLVQYVGRAPDCAPMQQPRRSSYKITKQVDPHRPVPKLGPLQIRPTSELEEDLPEGSRVLSVVESRSESGALEYIVLQDILPESSVMAHPLPSAYIEDCNEPLNTKQVIQILQNPDQSKISVYPPHRPKAGSAFLWSRDASAEVDYWSHDGYSWHPLLCTAPVIDGTTVERQFFKPLSGVSGFVRYAYSILGESDLVFIHYVGDADCYKELTPLEETSNTIQMPPKVLRLVETQKALGEAEFSFLGRDALDSEVEPYFLYDGHLLLSEAVAFLKDPDMTRVSPTPPFKPQGGAAYMWSDLGNENLKDDWRCDGYRWKSNALRKFPAEGEVVRKHYFKLIGADEKGFVKCAYQLDNNPGLVLITYVGDASLHVPRPHGNCKKETREHIRRHPSLIREVKAMCQNLGPKAACFELADKIDAGAAETQPNILRNRHQVYNYFSAMQKKKQKESSKAVAENLEPDMNAVVIEGDALRSLLGDSTVWQNLDPNNVKIELVTEVQ